MSNYLLSKLVKIPKLETQKSEKSASKDISRQNPMKFKHMSLYSLLKMHEANKLEVIPDDVLRHFKTRVYRRENLEQGIFYF